MRSKLAGSLLVFECFLPPRIGRILYVGGRNDADALFKACWLHHRLDGSRNVGEEVCQDREVSGDFIWHDHQHTDETFIVLEGILRIDFRDGAVHVAAGEMFVVPKGVEHKPYGTRGQTPTNRAARGTQYGPRGGERTAENDVSI